MDGPLQTARSVIESEGDRVVRCRLLAEEYWALADHALSQKTRDAFVRLANAAEAMADAAQAHIDVERAMARHSDPIDEPK